MNLSGGIALSNFGTIGAWKLLEGEGVGLIT